VPVAELAPGELVEVLISQGELVALQGIVHEGARGLQSVQDPAVRVGQLLARRQLADLCTVHERELGGVVELRREVTGRLRGVLPYRKVRTRVGTTSQGEAQRVSAIVAHPVHRSMPLPRDLDILRPCSSRTRPWRKTSSNGTCGRPSRAAGSSPLALPCSGEPSSVSAKVANIIMRATQKNRMS